MGNSQPITAENIAKVIVKAIQDNFDLGKSYAVGMIEQAENSDNSSSLMTVINIDIRPSILLDEADDFWFQFSATESI